jgi:16S rRNA (guanine527-N7)-methyltransferase
MTIPDAIIPDFVRGVLARLHVEASAQELAQLSRYLDLLLETNQQFNLTAVRDRDEAWRRHVIDSLTLLPHLADLPKGAKVIDVGSGGGLPGIPLAVTQPQLFITLLEATGKKARFLERCISELGLPQTRVVPARAESAGQEHEHRQRYDLAVCRALGPMREVLEYLLPLVRIGGSALAMKGPTVAAELEQAGNAMTILGAGELEITPAYPDEFAMDAVIVSVAKAQATPRAYPRLPGTPRHQPL